MKRFAPFVWPGVWGTVIGAIALLVNSVARQPRVPDLFFWACVALIMVSIVVSFVGTLGCIYRDRDGEPLD